MLVLTRKSKEAIWIGDSIKLTIVEVKGNQVRVGIEAPESVPIYRGEVYEKVLRENRLAAGVTLESFKKIKDKVGGQ